MSWNKSKNSVNLNNDEKQANEGILMENNLRNILEHKFKLRLDTRIHNFLSKSDQKMIYTNKVFEMKQLPNGKFNFFKN